MKDLERIEELDKEIKVQRRKEEKLRIEWDLKKVKDTATIKMKKARLEEINRFLQEE